MANGIRPGDLILVSSQSLGVRGLYIADKLDADSVYASDPDGDEPAIHVNVQDIVSIYPASQTRK